MEGSGARQEADVKSRLKSYSCLTVRVSLTVRKAKKGVSQRRNKRISVHPAWIAIPCCLATLQLVPPRPTTLFVRRSHSSLSSLPLSPKHTANCSPATFHSQHRPVVRQQCQAPFPHSHTAYRPHPSRRVHRNSHTPGEKNLHKRHRLVSQCESPHHDPS